MIKEEVLTRLKEDSIFLTKLACELEKPYTTVRAWVYRGSSRLEEYRVLKVLARLLGKDLEDIMED